MTGRIESRYKRRRWLPKWWPRNVYALIWSGDAEWDDMLVTAGRMRAEGAFAVLVENGERIATLGGVEVETA